MTNDRMFKAVLTSKEARDYLVDIISGITGLPEENLKREITYIIITLSPFIQFNRFTEETTYENQN